MAKGNGGTRGSNPRSMYGGGNAPVDEGMIPAQFQRYVDEIANNDYPVGWNDLDVASRELALMEAGFTGIADEGAENILFEVSKDDMLGWLADRIVSNAEGYTNSDESFTIGYKDGSRKEVNAITEEIAITYGGRTSSRTRYDQAYRAMDRRNISFVILEDGARGTYYANGSDGLKMLKRYSGFEKWTNGRGEKRRDYIQDDWI